MKRLLEKFLLSFIFFGLAFSCTPTSQSSPQNIFHEKWLNTLNQNLIIDLKSPSKTFDYIWQSLAPEITVYPSEGYYYFSLIHRDQIIQGNLSLFWSHRHLNQLNFYYEVSGNDKVSGHLNLGPSDGLIVKEISLTRLVLLWKNKEVIFNFFIPSQLKHPSFFQEWDYIGTAFDESGLQFHLMQDKISKLPFWILDQNHTPPSNLLDLSDHLYSHPRSEFLFLKKHNEYILIGVKEYNIQSNSWYDGPSDQMPDFLVYTGKKDWTSLFPTNSPGANTDSLSKYAYNSSHERRFMVETFYRYQGTEIIREAVKKCYSKNLFTCLY